MVSICVATLVLALLGAVVCQSTTLPALCVVPSNAAQLGGDKRPLDGYSTDYGSAFFASLRAVAGYKTRVALASYNQTILGFLVTVTLGNASVGVFDRVAAVGPNVTIALEVPQNCASQAAKDASATFFGDGGIAMYQSVVMSLQLPASARGVATLKALVLVTDGVQQRFRVYNSTFDIDADATVPVRPVCSVFRTQTHSGTAPGCFCGGRCYSNDTWQLVRKDTLETNGYVAHWGAVRAANYDDLCGVTATFEPFPNGTATPPHLKSLGCNATTVYGFCDAAQGGRQCCFATGCASCSRLPDRCDACGRGYVPSNRYLEYSQCVPIEFDFRRPAEPIVLPAAVDCNGNITISFSPVVDEQFDHEFDVSVSGSSGVLSSYKFDSTQNSDVPFRHPGDTITFNVSAADVLQKLAVPRHQSVGALSVRVTSSSALFDVRSNNFTTATCCVAGCECDAACSGKLACVGGLCCVPGYRGCSCDSTRCYDGSLCGGSNRVCMNRTECTNASRVGDACAVETLADNGTLLFACNGGTCQCSQQFFNLRTNATCGVKDTDPFSVIVLGSRFGAPVSSVVTACGKVAQRRACVNTAVPSVCSDLEMRAVLIEGQCQAASFVEMLSAANCTWFCDSYLSVPQTAEGSTSNRFSSLVALSSTAATANQTAAGVRNSTMPAASESQPAWVYGAAGAAGGLVVLVSIVALVVCLCRKQRSTNNGRTAQPQSTMAEMENNQRANEYASFTPGMVSARDERTAVSTYGAPATQMRVRPTDAYGAMPAPTGAVHYRSPHDVPVPSATAHYDDFIDAQQLSAMTRDAPYS